MLYCILIVKFSLTDLRKHKEKRFEVVEKCIICMHICSGIIKRLIISIFVYKLYPVHPNQMLELQGINS